MNLFSEIQLERANSMLRAINEDLKPKEKYHPIATFESNNLDVYVCGRKVDNDLYDLLFNVLDFEGKTPKGMSANWRTYSHIKQELKVK